MNLYRFLREEGGGVDRRLLVAYVVSGVASGLLLAVIVSAANPGPGAAPPSTLSSLLLFAGLLTLFVLAEKYVLDQSVRTLEGIIRGVRVRIANKLRQAELVDFEKIGHPHVYSVLSQDTLSLGTSAYDVIRVCSSVIVMAFGFLYIATLSQRAFLGVILALAVGTFLYLRNQRIIQRELREAAAIEGAFFESLRHLLLGFKEQRMNAAKSRDLFERSLHRLAVENEKLKIRTGYRINSDEIFAPVFFYLLIGFIIYILPRFGGADGSTSQVVTMILFILGPIGNVVSAYPALAKAGFAIDRIRGLEAAVDGVGVKSAAVAGDFVPPPFAALTAHGITFTYRDPEGHPGFTAGPFDLEIARGSVTFLVGGNGTGKSTLLHLLSGLYAPERGHIAINGKRVARDQLAQLRAYYSIILQDFHLFDRLYGVAHPDFGRADDLIQELGLTGITRVLPDGRFERIDLSTGQKKRLALLVSELDDREVFMFDEWAADQDPEHRRAFYRRYLPELKRRGKTVIVATHDDHYFDAADEVIQLVDGKIAYRGRPAGAVLGF